jgi:hypothetical protein
MDGPRRDWQLIAAGVVLMLVVLAVTGRLQSRGPGPGSAGSSAPTAATAAPDSSSGLSVAGRVRLPGQPAAVAVGEGAVWVQGAQDQRVWRVPLAGGQPRSVPVPGVPYGIAADAGAAWVLSGPGGSDGSQPEVSGRLLRLDPSTGRVTTATPLPELVASLAVGPVVGAGAVWLVGSYSQLRQGGSMLLRVDRASGRVVGWYRSTLPWHLLLAAGPQGAWVVTGAAEVLHVIPA